MNHLHTPVEPFSGMAAWHRRPVASRGQRAGLAMAVIEHWVDKARQAASVWVGAPVASDWSLWKQACGGDPSSARDLVRQLTPQALGLARQLLGRPEDAEDAVQESFLRLWSARPQDTHGARLSTYFNTIVLNRCKTQLMRRRELSVDPSELLDLHDAWQSAHDQPAVEDGALSPAQLQAALKKLPARQRMALAMWAYADASVAEIAQALDLDANAAHQLLHRAKRKLRETLLDEQP